MKPKIDEDFPILFTYMLNYKKLQVENATRCDSHCQQPHVIRGVVSLKTSTRNKEK